MAAGHLGFLVWARAEPRQLGTPSGRVRACGGGCCCGQAGQARGMGRARAALPQRRWSQSLPRVKTELCSFDAQLRSGPAAPSSQGPSAAVRPPATPRAGLTWDPGPVQEGAGRACRHAPPGTCAVASAFHTPVPAQPRATSKPGSAVAQVSRSTSLGPLWTPLPALRGPGWPRGFAPGPGGASCGARSLRMSPPGDPKAGTGPPLRARILQLW